MKSEPNRRDELCREVFANLSNYLDHELPPSACKEIEKHIAGCEPCIAFAESLRKTIELCHDRSLGEAPSPLPPQVWKDLAAACQKAIESRKAEKT